MNLAILGVVGIVAIVAVIAIVKMVSNKTSEGINFSDEIKTPELETEETKPIPNKPTFNNAIDHARWMVENLDVSPWSIRKELGQYPYTEEEINQAVEHCGADWFSEAKKVAHNYYVNGITEYVELYNQMIFEGFSEDQIGPALVEIFN